MDVGDKRRSPANGFLANGAGLRSVLEQPDRLLDSRDDAATWAITRRIIFVCSPGNIHVVPGAGVLAGGAELIGPVGDLGEGNFRPEEVSDLTAGLGREQVHGEGGDDAMTGFTPGKHIDRDAHQEDECEGERQQRLKPAGCDATPE